MIRVVILSKRSIFAEGVASRLRQYPQEVNVSFVDPQGENYLEEIEAIHPDAVLIDAAAPTNAQCCLLCELLIVLPEVTIIRLDTEKNDVQVVRSSKQEMVAILDILSTLKQS